MSGEFGFFSLGIFKNLFYNHSELPWHDVISSYLHVFYHLDRCCRFWEAFGVCMYIFSFDFCLLFHIPSVSDIIRLLSVLATTETETYCGSISPHLWSFCTSPPRWSQVCLYWYDIPASSIISGTSSTHSTLIPLEAAAPLLTLSLLPSNQCNYQPRCVFVVHGPSLHHAEQVREGVEGEREGAWMGESKQGRYIPELTNYYMWVIKRH